MKSTALVFNNDNYELKCIIRTYRKPVVFFVFNNQFAFDVIVA